MCRTGGRGNGQKGTVTWARGLCGPRQGTAGLSERLSGQWANLHLPGRGAGV